MKYLVEIKGGGGELLAGDDDDCVAADDGGREQRHEAEQREAIRARDADHAHRLVDLDRASV